MKSILATALLLMVFGFTPKPATTIYYFYYSRGLSPEKPTTTARKSTVMFTTIREGILSENEIKGLAHTWGDWVNKKCVNPNGCTSDLNYYFSKEQAEKRLQTIKEAFADASKYIVTDVEF